MSNSHGFPFSRRSSVRALPVPRKAREGWSGGRRQSACEAPFEAGLTHPPRAARQPRAPKARRCASRRSTFATSVSADAGAPAPASSRSVRFKAASRKRPLAATGREQDKRGFGGGDNYPCESEKFNVDER